MFKILIFLLAVFANSFVYGQTDPLTREERRALDSMFKNDEFIKLMLYKDKSYFDVNIGLGNGIFSLNNNALNAAQSLTNKIYFSPSVGYYHKTGFALTLNGFISDNNGSLNMYQYAISPSYTYDKKNIAAGISYTWYIDGADAGFDVSPFKNDFYASVTYKKPWIEPGLAIGYAYGKEVEYYDTSFWFSPPPPGIPRIIHIRDTITTKLSGFSLTFSGTHKWNFYELINKKDAIQLQPTMLLNAGSQKWNTAHSSSLNYRLPLVQNYLKRRYGDGSTSTSFNVQSLGFLAEVTYYFGKFYFQPQLYLDYYLPSTTEKKLTTLFSAVVGFSLY
jgi:hypothetical protein